MIYKHYSVYQANCDLRLTIDNPSTRHQNIKIRDYSDVGRTYEYGDTCYSQPNACSAIIDRTIHRIMYIRTSSELQHQPTILQQINVGTFVTTSSPPTFRYSRRSRRIVRRRRRTGGFYLRNRNSGSSSNRKSSQWL